MIFSQARPWVWGIRCPGWFLPERFGIFLPKYGYKVFCFPRILGILFKGVMSVLFFFFLHVLSYPSYQQVVRFIWRIETMVLLELNHLVIYTARKRVNRLARFIGIYNKGRKRKHRAQKTKRYLDHIDTRDINFTTENAL